MQATPGVTLRRRLSLALAIFGTLWAQSPPGLKDNSVFPTQRREHKVTGPRASLRLPSGALDGLVSPLSESVTHRHQLYPCLEGGVI